MRLASGEKADAKEANPTEKAFTHYGVTGGNTNLKKQGGEGLNQGKY